MHTTTSDTVAAVKPGLKLRPFAWARSLARFGDVPIKMHNQDRLLKDLH
jgi:hypothetical protein